MRYDNIIPFTYQRYAIKIPPIYVIGTVICNRRAKNYSLGFINVIVCYCILLKHYVHLAIKYVKTISHYDV